MRLRWLLLFLLPALALADWTALTESNPSGYSFRTWTMLAYDSTSRAVISYEGFEDGSFPQTIYSNSIFSWAVNSGGTTITGTKKITNNWKCNCSGSPYITNQLTANATANTPPDQHPYFGVANDGNLYLLTGLSQYIRDTIVYESANVNTTTETITLNHALRWFANRDAIVFGANPPGGITAGIDYFIIRVDSINIKVATNSVNAAAGTAINLTSQGNRDSIWHSTSDTWHPYQTWQYTLNTTGVWAQQHPSTTHHRGTFGQASSVVWMPDTVNKFLIQQSRNYEATAQYPWTYKPSTNTYVELTSAGNARNADEAPNNTTPGAMTWVGGSLKEVIYFGDSDSSNADFEGVGNDLYYFTGAEKVWHRITPVTPRPRKRQGHAVVWIPGTDSVMVAGGFVTGSIRLTDTWIYDIGANTWDSLAVSAFTNNSGGWTYGVYDRYRGGVVIKTGATDSYFMSIGTPDIVDASGPPLGGRMLLGAGR